MKQGMAESRTVLDDTLLADGRGITPPRVLDGSRIRKMDEEGWDGDIRRLWLLDGGKWAL
jgi:hypothetical protein